MTTIRFSFSPSFQDFENAVRELAAVVAPDDLTFATCRAFEVYREEEGHSVIKVFRVFEDALLWIEARKND